MFCQVKKKNLRQDLPGAPVVKNLPADTGVVDLISALGRFHKPRSNEARFPELLSLCSREHALQLEEAPESEAPAPQ